MDSVVNEAANQAWKFGAKALDKWTKSRDAKKQQAQVTVTETSGHEQPNVNPGTQESVIQQPITLQKPEGDAAGIEVTLFMSTKYPDLAALPMFPLSDEKEQAARARTLEHAARYRGNIRELNLTLGQKAILHLSGGSAIQTVNKLENGLNRWNAQSSEMIAEQNNRIVLTRWTLAPSENESSQVRHPPLLVDVIELQVQAFSEKLKGTHLYVRANTNIHINIDGQFDAQVAANSSWHTGVRYYHDVKQLRFVHPDGRMSEMEVVRIQRRWSSTMELQAREKGFKKVGLEARFNQWIVPSLTSLPGTSTA